MIDKKRRKIIKSKVIRKVFFSTKKLENPGLNFDNQSATVPNFEENHYQHRGSRGRTPQSSRARLDPTEAAPGSLAAAQQRENVLTKRSHRT
jgi:hypothetical protein